MKHLVLLFTSVTPATLLILTMIKYQKLEIGIENLFLSSSYVKLYKLATSTWMMHLWEFLYFYRLEVCIPALKLPTSSYANDNTTVDALVSLGWSDENLRLVN